VKITSATTIVELEILKGELGVASVRTELLGLRRLAAIRHPQYGHFVCTADTEAEALDGAFAKLITAISAALAAS